MRARDLQDQIDSLQSQIVAMRPAVSRLVDLPARLGPPRHITLVRFILRQTLVPGGFARAEIISLNSSGVHVNSGTFITAWDPLCEFYGAADAAWGIAYRLPDTPEKDLAPYAADVTYEILRMTCPGFAGC